MSRSRKKRNDRKKILIAAVVLGAMGIWMTWNSRREADPLREISTDSPTEVNPSSSLPQNPAPPNQPPGAAASHPPAADTTAKNPFETNDPSFDFTPTPPLQRSIADRFGKAEVLYQAPDIRESARYFSRTTLYRTNFKYPLLRVDDRFEKSDGQEAPQLISRTVRVADHLLVKIKSDFTENQFSHSLESLGFKIRKKMSSPRHYLVQFEATTPEAADRARESLKQLNEVDSVDPDFIVSVD